ncbi:glycosyltransferase [Patescibacteria group bacterium]|nr:glycosyltransferase [Patescibacteria group bacterium]
MKIALVHDYLKEIGGAERVLEALSDLYPDAPIFTTLYQPSAFGPHRARLEKKWGSRVHQSFFRFIPFAPKLISPLRLLSPWAFKQFNFSDFDLIITSATGAYFPNALNKKSARLVCYCHTPPRYLYGLPTARNIKKYPLANALAEVVNHFLRLLDFHWAQNVDQFIANSHTTAARIQKFYRRDSVVINPPVDTPKQAKDDFLESQRTRVNEPEGSEHHKKSPEQLPFYVTGGRLARAKRFDVAIEACNQLNVPLKVYGRDFAGTEAELKKLSGPTIEFLGEIDDSTKYQLLSQARAFLFPSDHEDFGIAPVEALAVGCPVVAYRSGGATETILDGKTGVFFDELTPAACAAAIQKLAKLKIKPADCEHQAANFSSEKFAQKIKSTIHKYES